MTDETWFYGTDTPKGAATLAEFHVVDGELAYHPVNGEPPGKATISEEELRRGIHLVLDSYPDLTGTSNEQISFWVAKSVNALLPFGEEKCKAIVGECGRIKEASSLLSPYLYFLTYSLFDPPRPPGYFDASRPVWVAPIPDDKRAAHPRWPVEIIENVPTIRGHLLGNFGGYAPSFAIIYSRLRNRIHLRKSPLTTPR